MLHPENARITNLMADAIDIVERSSTIPERLTEQFIPVENRADCNDLVSNSLKRWCQAVAQGNWHRFNKRLDWDGWSIDRIIPILNRVQLSDKTALPKWAHTLDRLLQTSCLTVSQNEATLNPYSTLSSSLPHEFHPIVAPFVMGARSLLANRASSYLSVLSDRAMEQFERALLQQLTQLCVPTLEYKWSNLRQCQSLSQLWWQGLMNSFGLKWFSRENQTNHIKHQFIQNLLADGGLQFFKTYPVLARLVATTVTFWSETIAEFTTRLVQDRSELEHTFASCQKLGQVIAIQTHLSDPHHGGQFVIIATFEQGLNLVYKPRDLGIDAAYNQFLTWLNTKAEAIVLKPLTILQRSGYGWMEYVEHQPCYTFQEVQHYYRQAGMLVCLTYLLGSTDFHYENVIACGEHPVLVDLETLMQPQLAHPERPEYVNFSSDFSPKRLWNSVLKSGLLTRWDLSADGQRAHDVSGLGGIHPPSKVLSGSDSRVCRETPVGRPNVPQLNHMPQLPKDYIEDIEQGFEQMYRLLMAHRNTLLGACSPLAAFQSHSIRFVFRGTRLYKTTQQKILSPQFLTDGIQYSIELDRLNQSLVTLKQRPSFWELTHVEQKSLSQMDIPHFSIPVNETAILLPSGKFLQGSLESSCYDAVIANFNSLTETNLAEQQSIIRETLTVSYAEILGTTSADAFYHQQIALKRDVGDCPGEVMALYQLGKFEVCQEQYDKAREHYQQALMMIQSMQVQSKLFTSMTLEIEHQLQQVYRYLG